MSKLSAFLSVNPGPVLGASVLAVAAVGAGTYFTVFQPSADGEFAPQEVAMPVEDASKVATSEPAAVIAEVPTEIETAEPIAPTIDEVRSEIDGLTILAGRGEPNAKVTLFVDQVENSSVTSGNDGSFAIVAFLSPTSDSQVLSVVQHAGDVELATADIILAPQPVVEAIEVAPVKTNSVEPEIAEVAVDTAVEETITAAEVATSVQDAAIEVAPVVEVEAVVSQKDEVVVAPAEETTFAAKPVATTDPVETVIATVEPPQENVADVAPNDEITESTDDAEVAEVVAPTAQEVAAPAVPQAAAVEEPKTEVAILKSDESGVEVINRSSAPELMSNVEIDTISYSDEGDVLLSGRAQSQATSVRIYLDNTVITTLDVDTSGRWRGDLPDVDTGVYILRVDEVDVEGDVTSRVETSFKREAPEVLEAAVGNGNAAVKAITVEPGATLWAIARDRYGDGTLFIRVFDANAASIKDPNLIYPGQVFDLPD